MGKKYIIELEEAPFIQHFKNGAWETIYRVKGFNSLVFDWNGLNMLTPYTEPDIDAIRNEEYEKGVQDTKQHWVDAPRSCAYQLGYENGLNDAWEAARTLWNTPNRKEIFGHTTFNTVLTTLTAQETIEKIRQYEQEKEDFKVGDEVINDEDAKAVTIDMDDYLLHVLDENGVVQAWPREDAVKTGRHFPEIAEVLQKMRENNDNK